MMNRGPSFFHLAVVWCLLMGSASSAFAQCPGPYDNFPNFERFNLTPTGVGDTMRSNAVWGGDFHHINVDSGKTYVIDMCETVYIPDPGNLFFSPDDMVDFDPQITLVNDTLGDSLLFIMPSGVIVGHDDNSCGNFGNMPRIVYTSDFTGNLAVIVDAVTNDASNGFGCDSFAIDSARIFVTEILLGIQGIITPTNISCNGGADGAATVGVTGNVGPPSYLWSTGDTTASISGLGIGTYTVTVTDTIGNGDTVDITLTEPTALSATATATGNVSCNGFSDGSATASGIGGTLPYSYLWSNGDTTASPTTLAAGTNTVSVTDNNGCGPMTASVTITEPTAVAVSAVVDSSASGAANADGGATASASGGTMPYTYAWANGATTASITGVLPGTYTITVTDNNGCTGTNVTTIFAGPSASVNVDSTVSCFGFSDGGATATVVGGTMPYTYLWSISAMTASITGVTAGTYTVTVTDAGGLTSSNSVFISEPTAINGTITSTTDISCNGGADGSLTASASGGTGSYTYAWSNGTTTATNSGVMAGTYTVTVTDANGCTDVESETLTEPSAIMATTVADSNVTCNGFLNGGATASGSGGTMPYTYVWSNAATTASITGVAAGTYTVSITDNNGCGPATSSVTITEPTAVAATSVVDSNVTCNGFMDGGATATGSGGTMPYTYTWSNGATTASITGVAAGSYSVTVTDNNGCTATGSAAVTEPTALAAATAVDSNASCNGFLDGGATASGSGGTMPYTYAWSNAATTAAITGVAAGSYSVTVTDNNGCTATGSATITEPTALMAATVVDSNASCNGFLDGGATASGSGGTMPYTYAWSNSATTAAITGVAAATYTVTVTDNNGCTSTSSVAITEPMALTATSVVDSNITCNGLMDGGATASASGGTMPYTYQWSNAATTASITGLGAGTYTVSITDNNGCGPMTSSVTITEPAALSASAVVDSNVTCFGFTDGGATASGSGGTMPYTYMWSNAATTASITGVAAGTYTVSITDNNGCGPMTASVTITEPTALSASSVVDNNATCFGFADGGATASGSGGTMPYNFLWSNAATTASITGVMAGTYTVTVTDANACTSTSVVTITEPTALTTTTTVDSNATCFGFANGGASTATSGGTAPYAYQWSNGGSMAAVSGILAGTYTVTITDANGCTLTDTATITEPALLVAAADSTTDVSCNGFSDGTAAGAAVGGTMPYAYSWSNGATTAAITGLMAGTYTLVVTDANGCVDSASVAVNQPDSLEVTVSVTDVTCEGGSDGDATANIFGGTMPYNYLWDDAGNQTTMTASGLPEGMINVTVTDTNGCTASGSGMVGFMNPNPTLDLGADTVSGCRDTAVVITAPAGFTYNWSTGETTASITLDTSGVVSLVITDNNGCSAADSVQVIFQGPCVGVAEAPARNIDVRYFPNPTQGMLNIEINGLENEETELAVLNLHGQVILQENLGELPSNFRKTVDLSGQAQGIYFIRLKTATRSQVDRVAVQ